MVIIILESLRWGRDAQIVIQVLGEVIPRLRDAGVQGVVDCKDLGSVGGEADPGRGHQEHLVVQDCVLGLGADIRRDHHRAHGGAGPEELHWAGHTPAVKCADRQRQGARDPLPPVIQSPDRAARPVVSRHVVVTFHHLDVAVPPVLRAQLQLVHHVEAVNGAGHLVVVAQVGRVVCLDAEQGVDGRVPDCRVPAAVMKSVEPEVLAPREAGEAADVEAGEAGLVTVGVTATPGVTFGGREVTRAVGGPGEAETLIEAAFPL